MLIGGVAQLAEHRVCNAGVRGSNPLTSTNALPICDCGFPIDVSLKLELLNAATRGLQLASHADLVLRVEVSTLGRE